MKRKEIQKLPYKVQMYINELERKLIKCKFDKKQKINLSQKISNPIKDNRIVVDKTFALRFLDFVLKVNCSDACSEDEKESMISYSTDLLEYQIETAVEDHENEYLERCNAESILKKGFKFLKNG